MNHQPKGEMMDDGKKNGAELAFPFVETREMQGESISFGLTKREYFAAMAMQGFCSNIEIGNMESKSIAEFAVDQADALLAELAKTEVV